MKLHIRNPFRRKGQESQAPEAEDRAPLAPLTAQAVWDAPATFNRATRRRAGLWGRIWKWDLNATEETRRVYTPRYIRRHFDSAKFTHATTRRQRRHRAVIMRIVHEKGMQS